MSKPIVLFDGVCNLCNRAVQFILRHDKQKKFLFGSLQGQTGQELLSKFNLPTQQLNSFVLIEDDKAYTRSTAVLRMLKNLGGGWSLLYAFMIIPAFIRNGTYNWIARNRYKWFGKKEECWVPTPELKERFLD
ncbi:MAG: thiol-disulfide oxidoreductase DCC family protein [Chitinophagaceae bacterium]